MQIIHLSAYQQQQQILACESQIRMAPQFRVTLGFDSIPIKFGGPSRNRTGVDGFANRCVTTPPSGLTMEDRVEGRELLTFASNVNPKHF